MIVRAALAALLTVLGASASVADTGAIMGAWQREDGIARVKVAPCGKVICMTNTYIRPDVTEEKVGERLEFDVKQAGGDAPLAGSVLDPKTGKSYSATITVQGDQMTTKGCVLGGIICKSTNWTRLR